MLSRLIYILVHDIEYYVICASTVMVYGIGFYECTVLSYATSTLRFNFAVWLKSLLTAEAATVLSWLLTSHLLVPQGLGDIYPFFSALIFLVISVFAEILIRVTSETNTTEWTLSMLSVIFSVNEGDSLLEVLVICCICINLFVVIMFFLGNIKGRIGSIHYTTRGFLSQSPMLFISIAVIILTTLVWNVSWLTNP